MAYSGEPENTDTPELNWSGTCFTQVAMRRYVTLTIVLAATSTVAGIYWREASNSREPTRNGLPPFTTMKPGGGLTEHGLITQVNTRNKSLEIDVNGREERVFWNDRTLITVAKHRVKPSALVPGVTVFVDVQQRENRLEASLIAVSPPNCSAIVR